MMRGRTVEITCANPPCPIKKEVRVADRKRGWGKYCSKSCKAEHQTAKHIKRGFYNNNKEAEMYPAMSGDDLGQE